MNQLMPRIRAQGSSLVRGWRSFWFSSEPAYNLGLVRIAFGALVVFWTLELLPDLYVRFGTTGVVPRPPAEPYLWSVFQVYTSDSALLVGWLVLLVSAVALTVGWHSRLAAVLVFVLILSFERRDPLFFNAGDGLIRIEALFLALSSCGVALSLDQHRRTGSFWSAQARTVWPIRLMQIQVSIIYLSTAVAKFRGDTWQNGTAVSYSLRLQDMLLLPTPHWLAGNALAANCVTWGTLVIELSIGLFVWNRKWRPWLLAAGVVMHLSIMLTMAVGFFTPAIFVLYLAFVPAARAKLLARAVEARVDKVRALIGSTRGENESVGDPRARPGARQAKAASKITTTPDDLGLEAEGAGDEDNLEPVRNGGHVQVTPVEICLDVGELPSGRHSRSERRIGREHQLT